MRYAVETVRRQRYEGWEIVIADNASDDDVAGYVQSLEDPRIVYVRSDALIPVTDNWNRALELSSGDYVIMLGDDDGLMRDSLSRLDELARRFDEPEVIYTSTYLFAYPRALEDHPAGFLQRYGYALFLRGATQPFVLDRAVAAGLARNAMEFRARYGFNMQFVALSRALIDRLSHAGPFYRSAFPDYFAMNAIFLEAGTIVANPDPLIIIGISPKSYGSYYAANQAAAGDQFLGSFPDAVPDALKDVILPGDSINNGWLFAVHELERAYGVRHGLKVDFRRYRRVQMQAVAQRIASGAFPASAAGAFAQKLTTRERAVFLRLRAIAVLERVAPLRPLRRIAAWTWHAVALALRGGTAQFVPWDPPKLEGEFRDALDVSERAEVT